VVCCFLAIFCCRVNAASPYEYSVSGKIHTEYAPGIGSGRTSPVYRLVVRLCLSSIPQRGEGCQYIPIKEDRRALGASALYSTGKVDLVPAATFFARQRSGALRYALGVAIVAPLAWFCIAAARKHSRNE
jgi:hypothetical protein